MLTFSDKHNIDKYYSIPEGIREVRPDLLADNNLYQLLVTIELAESNLKDYLESLMELGEDGCYK